VAGETFVLIEQNVTGAATCTSGGYENLQLLADRSLSYEFSFKPDSGYSSNGTLRQP
jgi:hypothetical protein